MPDFRNTYCPATGRECRRGCFNMGVDGANCAITELSNRARISAQVEKSTIGNFNTPSQWPQ